VGLLVLRFVLLSAILVGVVVPSSAGAAAPEVGLPSTSTTDGKFLGLAGVGLQTLTNQSKFFIGVSGSETDFSVSVFDGDLGGGWDNHDPLNSVKTEFLLYADPTRSGDPTGKTPIVTMTSDQFPDNNWGDLYRGPVHAAARSFSGNYFYVVLVRWSNEAQSANEFNSFKIKAAGQLSITPGQWAFVGAPINLGVDPAFGAAGNTYAGSWDWFVYVPPGTSRVNFTECDADARTGAPPGSPPDDENTPTAAGTPRVTIPPDIRYSVLGPSGSIVVDQPVPSGNTACKTGSADVTSGGVYRWIWTGVDAHNLVFVNLTYETFGAQATPFPVGTASPTATTTPTVTPTGTAGPPSATSSPSPTSTPQPARGGGGGVVGASAPTNTPAPRLTAAPTASTPSPAATLSASPRPTTPAAAPATPSPAGTPAPAAPTVARPVVVSQLPNTGGPSLALAVIVALVLAGGGLALRRR
jgi:LPXTG-motif cell wall-anchored protein